MKSKSIFRDITDRIIENLEAVDPSNYQSPFAEWAAQGLPKNPITENAYQGINIPALWIAQQERRFTTCQWATFKQWKERGASVRKGQRATNIVFYKSWEKEQETDSGETESVIIPMLRQYCVFNADQVDGYEGANAEPLPETDPVKRCERTEVYCRKTGADIRHGENRAYYSRKGDFINMPKSTAFIETEDATATENYYATLLHELTHWTGAPHRLNRDKAQTQAEIEKYAFEELIAELGAAFLCAKLGITQTPRDGHAIYIKGWLKALKSDPSYIVKAAAKAAKATAFLDGFQE